jgi:hypothetical protein
MPEKQLKFRQVMTDGCDGISYVTIEKKTYILVLYAFIYTGGHRTVTHQDIYMDAVAMDLVPEEPEPNGGGIYDFRTGEVSGSISYQLPENEINDRIINYFQRADFQKRC